MNLTQKLEAAAKRLRCKPADFMAWRDLEAGGLSVIAPSGQKFVFDAVMLEKMAATATERAGAVLKEAGRGNAEIAEAEKAAQDTRTTTSKRRTRTTRDKKQ